MLEHSTLLLHEWTRSTTPEGPTWVRPIADGAGRRLGFVRHQKLAAVSWLFWLRKVRLDVFETEDASHLMTLTRSWTLFPIWELHDAEERHVGSVYPKSLVTCDGDVLGYIDLPSEQGRILDPAGHSLARVGKRGGACELAFAAESANPFVRMLVLGAVLAIDAIPGR
jgi:hypothetical protein